MQGLFEACPTPESLARTGANHPHASQRTARAIASLCGCLVFATSLFGQEPRQRQLTKTEQIDLDAGTVLATSELQVKFEIQNDLQETWKFVEAKTNCTCKSVSVTKLVAPNEIISGCATIQLDHKKIKLGAYSSRIQIRGEPVGFHVNVSAHIEEIVENVPSVFRVEEGKSSLDCQLNISPHYAERSSLRVSVLGESVTKSTVTHSNEGERAFTISFDTALVQNAQTSSSVVLRGVQGETVVFERLVPVRLINRTHSTPAAIAVTKHEKSVHRLIVSSGEEDWCDGQLFAEVVAEERRIPVTFKGVPRKLSATSSVIILEVPAVGEIGSGTLVLTNEAKDWRHSAPIFIRQSK